jgi:predicted nucleic acid-binding protein
MGLRYVGVLGVLLDAKQRGHLAAVRPVLEKLVDTAGFWVHEDLRQRVLEAAGEL